MKHIRTRAVWLAIGLTLGGGALSYAGVAATSTKKATPHVSAEATETESPEPSEKPDTPDHSDQNDHARKHNHGYWVSLAAQCKDVNDTEDSITFKAPPDCSTNGSAHGDYVSSVAHSDAGKKSHSNHGNPTGKGGPEKG